MAVPNFQKKYNEDIIPALKKQFDYDSVMEIPKIKKIVINQGIGEAITDKKLITNAVEELSLIAGQKPVVTYAKRDISNFKLRRDMPIGVMVTLRKQKMYEFMERLIRSALPRIRDFNGVKVKFDGRGNYTLGINEQIIFPEIDLDKVGKLMGMNITFVTTAKTDEEAYVLLKEFGIPFKNKKNN